MIKCKICHSNVKLVYKLKDFYRNVEDKFELVKCEQCQLVMLNYIPTREDISKIYPKEYFKQPNIISRIVKFILMKKEVMRWKKY